MLADPPDDVPRRGDETSGGRRYAGTHYKEEVRPLGSRTYHTGSVATVALGQIREQSEHEHRSAAYASRMLTRAGSHDHVLTVRKSAATGVATTRGGW